jgi:RNA polymerase-binding transcription factor DksA
MLTTSEARTLLETERQRLFSLLASFADDATEAGSIGELTDFDQHQADTGTETEEQWRLVGTRHTIQQEIGEVDAALARLEDRTFGICEYCHQPIDDERLRAVPFARFCRDHQPGGELMTTWRPVGGGG